MDSSLLANWRLISLVPARKCIFLSDRLKWKPSEENTVDFKLLYVNSSFRIAILVRDGHYQEISQMTVEKSVLTEYISLTQMGQQCAH
jgi:hypothetical protein